MTCAPTLWTTSAYGAFFGSDSLNVGWLLSVESSGMNCTEIRLVVWKTKSDRSGNRGRSSALLLLLLLSSRSGWATSTSPKWMWSARSVDSGFCVSRRSSDCRSSNTTMRWSAGTPTSALMDIRAVAHVDFFSARMVPTNETFSLAGSYCLMNRSTCEVLCVPVTSGGRGAAPGSERTSTKKSSLNWLNFSSVNDATAGRHVRTRYVLLRRRSKG